MYFCLLNCTPMLLCFFVLNSWAPIPGAFPVTVASVASPKTAGPPKSVGLIAIQPHIIDQAHDFGGSKVASDPMQGKGRRKGAPLGHSWSPS